MARYWIYLNDQVKGPYEVDELIRISGFSRRTMVSMDDRSGSAGKWMSPAEIPELARIFQKADELHESSPTPAPKPAPKPKRQGPAQLTAVAPPPMESHWFSTAWPWFLILLALAGSGYFFWNQEAQKSKFARERQDAQSLIELAPLPSKSQYSNLRQFLQEKQLSSRWEFERTPAELYNVTLSWPSPDKSAPLPVYAFEANLQASSVRGLNTAATRLLSEGFTPPPTAKPQTPPPAVSRPPKKSLNDLFPGAINDRRAAFEQGDFSTVWDMFSRRRKSEMSQSGINQASFERMQKLTYRPSSGVQQSIIKTRTDSDTDRLVLLRQSQPKHPDIYIKQRWIWEEDTWRLDDEEKKAVSATVPMGAESEASAPSTASTPAARESSATPPPIRQIPPGLPGLSDTTTR